jgi:DNA-binding NarL/FixJ family response regulator
MLAAMQEDLHLDVLLPVAEAVLAAGTDEERSMVGSQLRTVLALIGQRTLDGEVRARWFHGPVGGPLSGLLGVAPQPADGDGAGSSLAEGQVELLHLVIEGRTNAEIARSLGIDEPEVTRRLGELFASIGASSRAEATAVAFREAMV